MRLDTTFSWLSFLADRLPFSENAKAKIEKMSELTATEKGIITKAL